VGRVGWWRVEGDAEPDLDVPAGGGPDVFDGRRSSCCLWVTEGVDDSVMRAAKSCHAVAELVVTGERGSFVGEVVRLCCSSFRREETPVPAL
jgi:hypothetical protein